MSRAKKKKRPSLPPLPNQAALDRAMAAIRKMSPQEIFESSVRSGIYTPEGQLTESFGGPPAKKKARAKGGRIVGDIVNFSEPAWIPEAMKKRTVTAAQFKAQCLSLFDEVERTRTEIIVTRRGIPVARIVPLEKRSTVKQRARITGDLLASVESSIEPVWPLSLTLSPTSRGEGI